MVCRYRLSLILNTHVFAACCSATDWSIYVAVFCGTAASVITILGVTHVMCDFTPRGPSELSASKWVSCEELLGRLQPHAPSHQLDATKLKRLVTEWYQDHPSYAGLAFGDWCKRLKENDPQGHLTRVFKFPFEFTPAV